ncbi:MAG: ribonuclease HII [Clostridia bacterium]|nr:ribonuclease HII [Clostridia bacterium]
MPDYTYELEALDAGYSVICGTDEAGRGPLAGPVCAAAVILPQGLVIEGLNDSKKISEKKREKLFDVICKEAVSYGIAFATAEEIDEINILNASQLAMRRAVAMLSPKPDFVLVDGNIARDFEMTAKPIIKGDALSMSIAAASILAKVTRDRYCLEMDATYPEYHFAAHKGYPTKEHMDLVRALGPCPLHRKTFLKFLNK